MSRWAQELAEQYLAMLRDERGASEHTLRAYGRATTQVSTRLAINRLKQVHRLHSRAGVRGGGV